MNSSLTINSMTIKTNNIILLSIIISDLIFKQSSILELIDRSTTNTFYGNILFT